MGAVYPGLSVQLQSDYEANVDQEDQDAGEAPLDLPEHGNKNGTTLKSINQPNFPTAVDRPLTPVQYQYACSRNSNRCINTCLRLNYRWQVCPKCDVHVFVLFIFKYLFWCEIIWEPVPVDEREVNVNNVDKDDDDDDGNDYDYDDDDEDEEPIRLRGCDFWWKYVENKSTGDLWVVRAVVIFFRELRRNILEALKEDLGVDLEEGEEWNEDQDEVWDGEMYYEGNEDDWEDIENE